MCRFYCVMFSPQKGCTRARSLNNAEVSNIVGWVLTHHWRKFDADTVGWHPPYDLLSVVKYQLFI